MGFDVWPLCPFAEWQPWAYPSKMRLSLGKETYYKNAMSLSNPPIAMVQHIMAGYLWRGWDWPERGMYPKSWHFTIARDGTIYQHLRLQDGGYHAGVRDSQTRIHPPTWPLWRGLGLNVNKYTLGCELEGVPKSNGVLDVTTAQLVSLKRLHGWTAKTIGYTLSRLTIPAHAEIDVLNRVNDFDFPDERYVLYDYILGGDIPMTQEERAEFDRLIARVAAQAAELDTLRTGLYAGSESWHTELDDQGNDMRVTNSYEIRSRKAKWRSNRAANGQAQSVSDNAASANSVVQSHATDHEQENHEHIGYALLTHGHSGYAATSHPHRVCDTLNSILQE